ncbi:MAG TPA: hypothetical protein VN276_05975 [Bacteroidales bacterium]|nr:hypothetical protein [Bacteroidales bacterium]
MKPGEEIKKSNPFKVPDGYFESLTERTMSAIKSDQEKETNESKPVRRLDVRSLLAMAAAVAAFALVTTVTVRLVTGGRDKHLPAEENGFYADLAVEEIDTYMIESEWNETELPDTREEERAISTDAIIDYLMTETIDFNDIYELL